MKGSFPQALVKTTFHQTDIVCTVGMLQSYLNDTTVLPIFYLIYSQIVYFRREPARRSLLGLVAVGSEPSEPSEPNQPIQRSQRRDPFTCVLQ